MKRIGNLMEKMLTEENVIKAERLIGKNKPDNRKAQHIAKNAEKYGKRLFEKMKNGYEWHIPKQTKIIDSYKGKERLLKIPCLEDQAAQLAWLNIATPYIERRNYYYNCGSIPGAGQTRAVDYLRKKLKNRRLKYASVTDIRKFYDTLPHKVIEQGLRRIFKDEAFISFAMGFVRTMSEKSIGLAIGYPSSHWLANIALMELDHEMRRMFRDVLYVRYMDDVVMISANKRHLRKAVLHYKSRIESMGMTLKKWPVFRIEDRGITFLSYRFFNGYTIMAKKVMIRISRRMRKAKMTRHGASGIISYMGILKYCDSYNFCRARVYPYVKIRDCKKAVRRKAA